MSLAEYDSRHDILEVIQTSESSVSIEVPRNWRLWSGWCPLWWERNVQGWREWEDPLDDKDFVEATAFPALKPDETIFHAGLPDYTRNQRGWYRVKPWPPPRSPPTTVADGHDWGMTGADVPVELFDILLKYIGHEGDPDAKSGISMDKRELGLISLACRRWADSLRPHIFQMITLRSIKDAHTLLSFIRHSHSFIARYIEEVVLSQSLTPYPYSPWIHRTPVFAEIMGSLGFHGRLNVALCGPLPAGKFTKGVCEMLPTSVPSAFKGVECLELKDLHFKKLGDLVRIPRELPSLQGLKCSNVTWEETSSEELPPTIQYLSGKTGVAWYELRGCTDDRAAAWCAALLAPRWRDRLERSYAHQICRIVSALWQNIDGNEWKGLGAYRQEDCLGSPASLACPWQVKVHFTDRVARQPRRVHAIELYFSSVEEKDLERPDWSAIDRLTVALPSLGTLLVCSQSPAHLLLFHKEVVMQKMPNLHGSHKLKYALRSRNWEGQHNIYTPVACSGDKVRTIGPPVDSIRELF